MEPVNLMEFEAAARERLAEMAYHYYAGGAGDETTLAANSEAFARIALRPRVLVDVSRRSLATTVFGCGVSMPLLVAPMAFQALAHPDGELATARAARAAGTIVVLSTFATKAVEDVVAAARPSSVWFQLYVFKDRGATRTLVERAEAAGCKALVVTVDAPFLGRRERDVRNAWTLPAGVKIANLAGLDAGGLSREAEGSALASYFLHNIDPSLDWSAIAWLRGITKLPIVLKGVLRADDAKRAVEAGVDGIVVSNHGGRQLDGAVATIDALADVVDAVDGDAEVLVDGGVRRGVDVVRALALGAKAVLLGRPVLWGLATDGDRGVARVLELMRAEIDLAMALCGCPDVASVDASLLAPSHRA